jgi:hypothetical protein
MSLNSATHVSIVLDRSGSMASVREDTIGGFNSFLDAQRRHENVTMTLAQFDNHYDVLFDAVPIAKVPHLTDKTFEPRGSTALLDAIGRTIEDTGRRLAAMPEADRPSKVLFVIITDGQENASEKFTRAQVFEMISHQREVYSWEFVFIGANQDVIDESTSLGMNATNSLSYTSDSHGTRGLYDQLSTGFGGYVVGNASVVNNFFKR